MSTIKSGNTETTGLAYQSDTTGNLVFETMGATAVTIANNQNVAMTGNLSVAGNVTGSYILGNGSQLTGLPESYTNANVAAYLPTYTGNLTGLTGNVTTTGTVSATGLAGNLVSTNAVGTNQIANSAVTAAKLSSTAVTDSLGYTPVNRAGDTMTSTLNVPNLQINSIEQMSIKRHGDVSAASTPNDLNDQSIRNSVFYALNPTNSGHSNNGVGMYLSSYGLGGTSDNATDERAAQIYFGDTPQSGLHYRVKQGSTGWHPWVALSAGMRGVYFSSTDAQTYTDNQTGFTTLETTFTRAVPAMYGSSKFLVIATVNGSAGDDASAVIEFYNGSSWVTDDALRGAAIGYRGSFGDFSVVRAIENKQTVQYTAVFVHSPASTAATLGYRVRCSAENTGGFYLNRPLGTDGGYNTNSSRSTMLVIELTGNI